MVTGKPTIAIVGGGISGVALTIALLRRGIDVRLYEQSHAFGRYSIDCLYDRPPLMTGQAKSALA